MIFFVLFSKENKKYPGPLAYIMRPVCFELGLMALLDNRAQFTLNLSARARKQNKHAPINPKDKMK